MLEPALSRTVGRQQGHGLQANELLRVSGDRLVPFTQGAALGWN